MILVGIDVAKDKHDCFICNSEGEVFCKTFTFPNSMEDFNDLYEKIKSVSDDLSKLKVGLEATGHYSYNLLGFLLNKGLPTFVINPLHTNLYRKSLSLRKTKTDKVDAHTIAMMLMSDVDLKPYSNTLYHNEELKSLTRYRFDKVRERAKLKSSVSRLVTILFPELENLVSKLHSSSVSVILTIFHHLTRYSLIPVCLPQPTSRDSLQTVIPIWKNAALVIFALLYTMLQSMFVIGNLHLPPISRKNVLRASITMSRFPTL